MNINLHIERLILDGLPIGHGQGKFVKAAVEMELSSLLAEDGLNQDILSEGAVPSVKAGGIQLKNDGSPAALGRQIAQAVYGEIGKSK
jgi:hypothetical protein